MAVLYIFDEIIDIMQPLRFLRLFQVKSKNGEIKFNKMLVYQLGIIAFYLEFLGVIVAIFQHYYIRGIGGIKPLFTLAVLMLLTILRNYFMHRNGQRIASILNQLEKIFPRSLELQQHYELDAMVKRVRRHFRIFEIFIIIGIVGFEAKAFYSFVLIFCSGNSLNDDCFPIPSWYPCDLKHSYAWYPFIFIIQIFVALSGALFTMNWNHTYSMVLTLICEHYKYMAKIFSEIDAKESNSGLTSRKLLERIHGLMNHLQLLDNLCDDTNVAFVTPLIIIDAICVTTICLPAFLISNEHFFSIAQHVVPAIVIIWTVYETSCCGEMLEQASNDVGDGIYNHNWYEGSMDHRKLVLMLLQWRSEPRRLSWAKSFFSIKLSYFNQIIIIAYELYSFQRSIQ